MICANIKRSSFQHVAKVSVAEVHSEKLSNICAILALLSVYFTLKNVIGWNWPLTT